MNFNPFTTQEALHEVLRGTHKKIKGIKRYVFERLTKFMSRVESGIKIKQKLISQQRLQIN